MDVVSHKRLMNFLVIFLLVLNIVLVILFVLYTNRNINRAKGPAFDNPDIAFDVLKEELDLNEKQVNSFKSIRLDFFAKERVITEEIRSARDSMNEEMFEEFTDSAKMHALARRISQHIFRMEELRYEQSEKIKAVCNPEQQKKFKQLVREIRDYLKPSDRRVQ